MQSVIIPYLTPHYLGRAGVPLSSFLSLIRVYIWWAVEIAITPPHEKRDLIHNVQYLKEILNAPLTVSLSPN
ncbi:MULTISPECIES: hypothetical protein [unclassified Stygiolobus]|uniref:hypothetical protein n=1 Tax=unclassified Stygiolobus TaxID=2824672 RepID=UPI00307CE134